MIGAALGYPVTLVMPANVSRERKQMAAAFGAELIYSDPLEGSDGAIRLCREILADPERYFKPDQYNNPANPLAHYETTGPEIWEQTDGRVTHFVAGIGTSGTIMGTGRYLKERNPAIQVRRRRARGRLPRPRRLEAHGLVDRARHLPRGPSST
jgi:cysteine synthase B